MPLLEKDAHLVDVTYPLSDVVKRLCAGDVVDEHDAHGSAVVGGSDRVEPLLSSSIPSKKSTHAPITASPLPSITHRTTCITSKYNYILFMYTALYSIQY